MQPQALSPASPGPQPRDAELLDILYEILADDTGEDHGVSVETIEAYLHEHARSPQSAGSLAAFFEKHGLSTDRADYGKDPALAAVPSGVHAGMLPLLAGDSSTAPAAESSVPLVDEATPARIRTGLPAAHAPVSHVRPNWLTPALVALALMLGLVGAVSAFAALEERALERELSLERLQLRATSEAVDALRAEARSLHQQLDVQRAQEQKLSEQLSVLQEAERQRREQELLDQQRGRRMRPAPVRRAPAPAPTASPEVAAP